MLDDDFRSTITSARAFRSLLYFALLLPDYGCVQNCSELAFMVDEVDEANTGFYAVLSTAMTVELFSAVVEAQRKRPEENDQQVSAG